MAGVAFTDLMGLTGVPLTLSGLKSKLVALCQGAPNPLLVTSWVPGDPSWSWVDITPRMIGAVLFGITTQAIRGMFLDLATDPGDPGDLSADQTPRAGFLSALGEGWYGTVRRGETYAATTVVLRNDGAKDATFSPFDLTFTTTDAAQPDGGRPSYRNEASGAYSGLGGTLTLAPGATTALNPLPVIAEQIGSYGNASPNSLACVTQSFGTLTVISSGLARGEGREAADAYRARCRLAAAKLSPGGPGAAYKYAATTNRDGTPLQRIDGAGPVGITKVYVSSDSATGTVLAYFATDSGAPAPATGGDVDSANANIQGIVSANIPDPLGVVPDCVTYTGVAATAVPIVITATAKIKRRPGMADTDLKTAAEAAVPLAWGAYFVATDIGGRDQAAGAGVIPTADLSGVVYSTALAGETAPAGLHAVAVTAPSGSATTIGVGQVATLDPLSSINVSVIP